jgi:hypothetical protein
MIKTTNSHLLSILSNLVPRIARRITPAAVNLNCLNQFALAIGGGFDTRVSEYAEALSRSVRKLAELKQPERFFWRDPE